MEQTLLITQQADILISDTMASMTFANVLNEAPDDIELERCVQNCKLKSLEIKVQLQMTAFE